MHAAHETLCSLSIDLDEERRDRGEDTDDMLVPLPFGGGGEARGVRPSRLQPTDHELRCRVVGRVAFGEPVHLTREATYDGEDDRPSRRAAGDLRRTPPRASNRRTRQASSRMTGTAQEEHPTVRKQVPFRVGVPGSAWLDACFYETRSR